MGLLGNVLNSPLYTYYRITSCKDVVDQDLERYGKSFMQAAGMPEFRSLFYYRLTHAGLLGRIACLKLKFLRPGQTAFYLNVPKVGGGLYLSHAFATFVHAQSIGEGCSIAQQVTVAPTDGKAPIIGNRVTIDPGAKILGAVTIGDGAHIGPNAVVTEDVAAGAIVSN